MKQTLEDYASRLIADWRMPRNHIGKVKCRYCKHCGTAREVGVICKNPKNGFCPTGLDAVCSRFDPRG